MSKIKINDLVLRDAHQSLLATRMLTEDMLPIADKLNKVGYWALETWGGATFDSCIRFLNEDPWERLRKLKEAMPNTKMMMLLRGQNLLGYRHYADDVVEKFVERAAANGIDVFRIFDALNDPRNLIASVKAVKKVGKHAQLTISYTISPVHTIESYIKLGLELKELGADSICIKDMAGLLKPMDAYNLVKELKNKVGLPINVHSHATTGMSVATLLKSVEAGAEILDTTISSMSMGTSHSPTETIVEILKGTEFDTGLDVKLLVDIAAYFRDVRKKYKQFESAFLGADTRILVAQVPGGMLSNLESQLREQNAIDKLDKVLEEIAIVQKDFGYPPLVTPTSQIVGTQAVFNVLFGRYNKLTTESMNLLVGNYGKCPADPNPDLVKKALEGLKLDAPITYRPADKIPNELHKIEEELKSKLNVKSVSIEDVLTYAMFPQVSLKFFNERSKGPIKITPPEEKSDTQANIPKDKPVAKKYIVNVDGDDFEVIVREEGTMLVSEAGPMQKKPDEDAIVMEAPVAGVILRFTVNDGDEVKEGQTVIIMESMKMELEVKAIANGRIKFLVGHHAHVKAQQPIAEILS